LLTAEAEGIYDSTGPDVVACGWWTYQFTNLHTITSSDLLQAPYSCTTGEMVIMIMTKCLQP